MASRGARPSSGGKLASVVRDRRIPIAVQSPEAGAAQSLDELWAGDPRDDLHRLGVAGFDETALPFLEEASDSVPPGGALEAPQTSSPYLARASFAAGALPQKVNPEDAREEDQGKKEHRDLPAEFRGTFKQMLSGRHGIGTSTCVSRTFHDRELVFH